ncbi:MAG: hypothetical protein ACYTEQ_09440 [Planctomycetota bacterium]|jgi:hypothetical protein
MPDNEPTTLATEMIAALGPHARVDAFMVIDMRERLMSETGCDPETARRAVLAALEKRLREKGKIAAANRISQMVTQKIDIRGIPEEARYIRLMIPNTRQRAEILLDWIEKNISD